MAFLGQVMAFLNSLRAVLNRRADVHKGLDLILKPAVDWDKCTTRHARVKNSLLHTESRELFTGRHARIKHTETAVSQSLRSVCCLLSLTLCLSRFKPITIFFLRCSQHTHTYASAITKTLFNKSWISSSRTTHQTANTHKHAHRHKRYLNLFFSWVVLSLLFVESIIYSQGVWRKTPLPWHSVCVSLQSGALLLLTPLSALVECISYRGGGVEGGGTEGCVRGERDDRQYKLIKRPQPRFGLSLKTRVHAHTHACAHAQTQKCTQTAGPCLIDRWLSPTNRRLGSTSMPPPHFCFFFTLHMLVWFIVLRMDVYVWERTFQSNKGGIRDALVGRGARGLSITAVRINPKTSIRRQRPSQIAASREWERERWSKGGIDRGRERRGWEREGWIKRKRERGSISREAGGESLHKDRGRGGVGWGQRERMQERMLRGGM